MKPGLSEKKNSNSEIKCLSCLARANSFCKCIAQDKLNDFSKISSQKKFKDGSHIFLQGEKNDYFYNLVKGNVKIFKVFDDGRVQIVGFLYPGDFFGLHSSKSFSYTAECIGEVTCCIFNHKDLDFYLDKNIELAKHLLHMTTNELTLMQDRVAVIGRLSARERIINFFLNISSQRKRIGWQDNPIVLPMTRNEMADYLGLTVETVSREITKLKSEQIIKMIDSKQVFLNNKPLLESELSNNSTAYQAI